MIVGFIAGLIVGFLIDENWVKILTWIKRTSQNLIDLKVKPKKSK